MEGYKATWFRSGWGPWLAWLVSASMALTLVGCPYGADLDNQSQYYEGGCPEATAVLESECGGSACHGGPNASGSVDLTSPDFEAALLTTSATYQNVLPDADGCPQPPPLYVDPVNVEESWLLKKVRGTHGACGDPMPPIGGLSGGARKCVEEWVAHLAAKGPP